MAKHDEVLEIDPERGWDTIERLIDSAKAGIDRIERERDELRAAALRLPEPPSGGGAFERIGFALGRLGRLEERQRTLIAGLEAVRALIASSRGVIGLHENGDPAPWEEIRRGGEFESWLRDFDDALDAVEG